MMGMDMMGILLGHKDTTLHQSLSLAEQCLRKLKYRPCRNPQFNQLCGPGTRLGECREEDTECYRRSHSTQFYHALRLHLAMRRMFRQSLLADTFSMEMRGIAYPNHIYDEWHVMYGCEDAYDIRIKLYAHVGLDYVSLLTYGDYTQIPWIASQRDRRQFALDTLRRTVLGEN